MPPPRPSLKDLMPANPTPPKDPAWKRNIQDVLIEYAFAPVLAKRRDWLDRIVLANPASLRSPVAYFNHLGVNYFHSSVSAFPKDAPRDKPRLHPALHEEMGRWLQDRQELEQELDRARVGTAAILNAAECLEDYAALLPESLAPALREFENPPTYRRLTADQLTEAKKTLAHSCDVLRIRMMANLLL